MTSGTAGTPRRILLSGVFGPFGVDDAWGRKRKHHGALPQPGHEGPGGGVVPVPPPLVRPLLPRRERRRRRHRPRLPEPRAVRPRAARGVRPRRDLLHRAELREGEGHGAPRPPPLSGRPDRPGRARGGDRGARGARRLRRRRPRARGSGACRTILGQDPEAPDRPPGPAEHRAPEHPRDPAPGPLREPPRPRRRLRERLPLLQHLALLRQGLPAVPRHRPRALRDGPPDRRPDRDRRLLRHGRELPEGHRPGPRAPRRDGAAPALLRLPDLLLGGGDPGVRPRQHGPPRRQLRLDRLRVGDPDRQLRQERRRRRPPADPGAAGPRHHGPRLGHPLRGAPHAGEHPAPRSTSWSGSRRTWRSSCCSPRCR